MSTRPDIHIPSQLQVPRGATTRGDGIVVGSGSIPIDIFIDFLCPFCKQFEDRSSERLDRLVFEGTVSLIYHPLGLLDRLSTNMYSTRSAAASACAADIDAFPRYKDALFAHQPPEGGPGLDDAELVALGRTVGIDDLRFAERVFSGNYLAWAASVTQRANARGVDGTPTVLVAGVPVPADLGAIEAAVSDVVG
jgi:protein-disulfide isomerase